MDSLVADSEPIHHAGPKLLDHDIGSFDERQHAVGRARFLEVDLNAPLAAVQHRERNALPINERRGMADRVAARSFDLDDLGTGFRQHQGCQGTRQQGREVENSYTIQKQHSHIPLVDRCRACTIQCKSRSVAVSRLRETRHPSGVVCAGAAFLFVASLSR